MIDEFLIFRQKGRPTSSNTVTPVLMAALSYKVYRIKWRAEGSRVILKLIAYTLSLIPCRFTLSLGLRVFEQRLLKHTNSTLPAREF